MIRVLSEDTIQKIAAGEVIESPSSIVKELVENSIDSKADNIFVEIKNGGKDFIKVSDNGSGIEQDQVELAFTRHATSKISSFEDLYRNYNMGFRGEALASIIAVAKLSIMTKTKNANVGLNLIYDNNILRSKKSVGMNNGTIIEVSNLFEYIPVRKKFLKSDISEGNKITTLLYNFALGNPNISFTYIRDNREIFTTNNSYTYLENLSNLHGSDFIKNLINFDAISDKYKIRVCASNQNFYKGNRSMQYIFVNSRMVKSEEVRKTIEQTYNNLIPKNRFPAFIVFIETDPENIDINISPNKQKIKFNFDEELLDLIESNFTNKLMDDTRSKEIHYEGQKDQIYPSFSKLNDLQSYKRVLDSYKRPLDIEIDNSNSSNSENLEDFGDEIIIKDLEIDEAESLTSKSDQGSLKNLVYKDDSNFENYNFYSVEDENLQESYLESNKLNFLIQIFNKYLVFEDSAKTLFIIDKNRAYEKILYENLIIKDSKSEDLLSQELISPVIKEVTNIELETYKNNKNFLDKLGYVSDLFGDNKIVIRAYPYLLNQILDDKIFMVILDQLTSENNSLEKEKLVLKKAASLVNYKIDIRTDEEAERLYRNLFSLDNPYKSPRGKQIVYHISEKSIKRLFDDK